MPRKFPLLLFLSLAVVLTLVLASCTSDQGYLPLGITNLDSLTLSDDLTVGDDLTIIGDASIGGSLDTTGYVAGAVGVYLDSYLVSDASASWLILPEELAATTTTVTPETFFYHLDSTGAVTITLGTTDIDEGTLLMLYADDANTITIGDTNLRTSDDNALALTQYDTALLLFEGTDWVVLSTSANQ